MVSQSHSIETPLPVRPSSRSCIASLSFRSLDAWSRSLYGRLFLLVNTAMCGLGSSATGVDHDAGVGEAVSLSASVSQGAGPDFG
jgi:hypothetical protein